MCGIFGHSISDAGLDLESSRNALHTLMHRGPDQWDDWYDDKAYLGHRRLSILDLSEAGKQPMILDLADGHKIVMTANGEIWNYQDLYKELSGKYAFKSRSDSEVLLYGYREWGIDGLLERIDGMYAFSIYDSSCAKLYVVRDRFGIKPLYYTLPFADSRQQFVYASEIKAIFEHCPQLKYFSKKGVVDWLAHRGSYSGLTPYHAIRKLLPGYYVSYDLNSKDVEHHQYYELLDYVDDNADVEELEAHLRESVSRRLMSDVSVGLQLSGGVDSSLIADEMAAIAGEGIHSFSVGFKEAREAHLSEEPYARQVADQLGLTHHQLNIGRDDVRENFEHVLWLCDGMLDFPNTIPIYLLSQYSKDLVTVQLTGEGADELFGGYTKFRMMSALAKGNKALSFIPSALYPLINAMKPAAARLAYLHKNFGGEKQSILDNLNCYISKPTLAQIFKEQPSPLVDDVVQNNERFGECSFEKQLLVMDHKTYLHSVLERQDRGSMGASIESRVPFLDRKMVEWAMSLSVSQLYDVKQTKKPLKQLAAQRFGHDFAYRRKVGFPMPISSWMKDKEGLGDFYQASRQDDFVFADALARYKPKNFDRTLLNYSDEESQWVDWFMMVLRGAQDRFGITDVKA